MHQPPIHSVSALGTCSVHRFQILDIYLKQSPPSLKHVFSFLTSWKSWKYIQQKKTAVHHKSSWFILTWISSRSWNKEHGKRSNHRCRDIMPMADRQKLTAILLQLFQQLWSFWRLKLFVPVQIFPLNSYPPLKSWKNSMSITKEDASGWLGRCEILTNFVLPPHFRDKQRIF